MRTAFAATLLGFLASIGAGLCSPADPGGTLLVYDSATKPFSMENEIEPIAILLSRFEQKIERREAKALKPADIEAAAHIVVVGTGGFPEVDPASLALLKSTKKPLMAVGGASALAAGEVPSDRVRATGFADRFFR